MSTGLLPTKGGLDAKWIREEIDKRVTKELLDARLQALQLQINNINKGEDDTKSIALSAKRKAEMPHNCIQSERIDMIGKEVTGWTRWFRIVLVSAIAGIVVIGGTVLWRFWVLNSNVENTQISLANVGTDIGKIENNLGKLEESHKNLTQAVSGLKNDDELRLGIIKSTVVDAVHQAINDNGSSRKPR